MKIERFEKDNLSNSKEFYEANGFVIIKDAFNVELLSDFKCELSEVVRAYLRKAKIKDIFHDEDIFDTAMEELENSDHMYVASIYDTISQSPSFFRLISEKILTETVRLFLNNKNAPLYGYTNRCLIAPPSDDRRTYGWHQEVFYTVPRGNYIQSWAPLIRNTNSSNGTIEVAIGSHKEGIAEQTWNEIKGIATQIIVNKEIMDRYEKVSIDMELGELLLFSGYLAHQSGSNTSAQHRYSLVGMYHDVSTSDFVTPQIGFSYRGETPREYFEMVSSERAWKR